MVFVTFIWREMYINGNSFQNLYLNLSYESYTYTIRNSLGMFTLLHILEAVLQRVVFNTMCVLSINICLWFNRKICFLFFWNSFIDFSQNTWQIKKNRNVLKRAQKKRILSREVSFENSETGTFYWAKIIFNLILKIIIWS